MKLTLAAIAVLAFVGISVEVVEARGGGGRSSSFGGSHSVRGYTTRTGKYVPSHHATNRNGSKLDNWSTKGNINPYTGKIGTKSPY